MGDNIDHRIIEQITMHTQGPKEKIRNYLACLVGVYNQLDYHSTRQEQLDNAHRGLRPNYNRLIKRQM